MPAPPTPWDGGPLFAASPDTTGDEGRARLQDRLALLGTLGAIVSGAFLAAGILVGLSGLAGTWNLRYHAAQAANTVLLASLWLACRGAPRPLAALHALDAATLILVSQTSALLLWWVVPADVRLYTMLLGITYAVIARTLIVPSSARRTLVLSLASAAPFLVFVNVIDAGPHAAYLTTWMLLAVTMATIGSGVIFGLRREVREARRLGQYTLERKIGEGGMGVVYRARHVLLRRPTALKLLPPDRAGATNVRRFEREVRATAQLSHPNTVSIYDFGRTADGVFYYAMEYLDGLNLDELVRSYGAQPPARAVHILGQVCGSLREAHGIGLIHRDIKPSNVILCHRGGQPDVAKVVDFGLVKDLERTDGLSQANVLAGTPLYLAPECVMGHESDVRRDVYALGAVAYFLLTGQQVFGGSTILEICSHHLHTEPVPPSERLGRPIPPALERWTLRCLEKDPQERPQSAEEAAAMLAACPDTGTWTEEDGRQWWLAHERARAAHSLPGDLPAPESPTVSMPVDLRERSAEDAVRW